MHSLGAARRRPLVLVRAVEEVPDDLVAGVGAGLVGGALLELVERSHQRRLTDRDLQGVAGGLVADQADVAEASPAAWML